MIRWSYPFPWYNAWKSYAYTGGTIEPAWCWAPRELLAEVGCEVIAVSCQEVVGSALEFVRGLYKSA